jgi:hypothetical protein
MAQIGAVEPKKNEHYSEMIKRDKMKQQLVTLLSCRTT